MDGLTSSILNLSPVIDLLNEFIAFEMLSKE
jgi:hypothetical protein